MKTITLDYLRRWGWIFVITGVAQLFMHIFIPPQNTAFALFTVIYCGAMLLSFDLARGTPRVCLALPVTRRDLAWSWRIVSIVAPLVLFVGSLVLGNLVRAVVQLGETISFSQATFLISFTLLWLGVSFHLLVHFPGTVAAQDPTKKVKNTIIGGLWGLTIGGGFLLVMKMPKDWGEVQPWHWILMAGALISTVLGWLEAEEMVVNRAGPGRASEDAARSAGRGAKSDVAGVKAEGLSFLLRAVILTTLRVIAVCMVIFLGFQIFLRKGNQESLLEAAARAVQEPTTFFILVPLVLMTGLGWLVGIRHFRTLPLMASKLTLLVCGFFIVPAVLLSGAMGLLQLSLGAEVFTLEWVSRTSLMTAPMLLAPGLLLHFGLTWRSYFLVIMPVFMAAPLAMLVLPFLSVPVRGLICVVTWAAGAFLVHRSVTRRSETYRHTLTWPMRPA